jgi:hypothetical protein
MDVSEKRIASTFINKQQALFYYFLILLLGWSGTESTITEGFYWPILQDLDDR